MGKTTSDKRQWLNWAAGISAIWLLLCLPICTAKASSESPQKAYISCDSPSQSTHSPDYALMVCSHGSVARVSPQPGFSFGPSLSLTPCLLAPINWLPGFLTPGQSYRSSYSFRFLQLIFEHQIAINAP